MISVTLVLPGGDARDLRFDSGQSLASVLSVLAETDGDRIVVNDASGSNVGSGFMRSMMTRRVLSVFQPLSSQGVVDGDVLTVV